MASPKKKTSKTRKNLRKSQWKAQASREAQKALATAKTILKSLARQSVETDNTSEIS
jgi:ribosomal protein L32